MPFMKSLKRAVGKYLKRVAGVLMPTMQTCKQTIVYRAHDFFDPDPVQVLFSDTANHDVMYFVQFWSVCTNERLEPQCVVLLCMCDSITE